MEPNLPPGAIPFRWPAETIGAMDAGGAARLVAAAADVAVVVDRDGVVRDTAFGNADMAAAGMGDWTARPWVETVTVDSRAKVTDMLRVSSGGGAPRWRHLNHTAAGGAVPVRYLALDAGPNGHTIAIGRDMRPQAAMQQRLLTAQQAMERDYLRLRQTETRYRALFDLSDEAVFIVESARRRIVEANPAALRLAGEGELVGQSFASLLHPDDREAVIALLGAVAAAEQPAAVPARLVARGDTPLALSATLFRQERATWFLVRLARVAPAQVAPDDGDGLLREVVQRLPDAFVVTDDQLAILTLNAAFLDLTQLAREREAIGEPLGRFLGRPGIDLGVLVGQLREHGSLRNFSTIVRGRRGGQEEVEVTAVAAPDATVSCLGFAIRGVARRAVERPAATELPRSVEQLTELVGRVSLKEIVRESTDLIERLCIEAALSHTRDNRASAAEILGLSRQSLYSKLHRHGLGNLMAEPN